jgi:hypothetical protein
MVKSEPFGAYGELAEKFPVLWREVKKGGEGGYF